MVDHIAAVDRESYASTFDNGIVTSRPRAVASDISNTDITTKFIRATSRLPPGALIKDAHFTLFEAVGALEIGDPKMDSGCLDIIDDDKELEFDVSQSLTPASILWLMDELLCREVAWQMGYPLSQTLFTSYHIDALLWPDPVTLEQASFSPLKIEQISNPLLHLVFRSYCLGVIKTCDLTMNMVLSQHYYEEEDFATQLFNRELLHRFDAEQIIKLIEEALTWLASASVEEIFRIDLENNLNFRLRLLQAFVQHASDPPGPSSLKSADVDRIKVRNANRSVVENAFSPRIQQRLASSTPPRSMIIISTQQADAFWTQTIRDMSNVFSVLTTVNTIDLFQSYILLSAQDPQPFPYVRALLQSLLAQGRKVCGSSTSVDLLRQDLQNISLPSSSLSMTYGMYERHRSNLQNTAIDYVEEFLNKTEKSFINILRTICFNRSRCRRTLCHAVIEWDQIQAEAEELDDEIHRLLRETAQTYFVGSTPTFSYSVSSWIYHHKLSQMRLIIQLGFELSVYAPYELPAMYWYLAHLCDTHLAHLERISHFVSSRQRGLSSSSSVSNIELRDAELQRCHMTIQFLYRQFAILKAIEAFARGLHGLFVVIARCGKCTQPQNTYSTDRYRYEIRMRPFLHLAIPESIGFEQFTKLTSITGQNDQTILKNAAAYINTAKRGWEEILKMKWNSVPLNEVVQDDATIISELWSNDVRGCLKATIAASIAVDRLSKYIAITTDQRQVDDDRLKVTMPEKGDRNYWHPYWIVPQIDTKEGA